MKTKEFEKLEKGFFEEFKDYYLNDDLLDLEWQWFESKLKQQHRKHEQKIEQAIEEAWDEAIKLSDEVELQHETSTEEWMAFKRFRNTLRDKSKFLNGEK